VAYITPVSSLKRKEESACRTKDGLPINKPERSKLRKDQAGSEFVSRRPGDAKRGIRNGVEKRSGEKNLTSHIDRPVAGQRKNTVLHLRGGEGVEGGVNLEPGCLATANTGCAGTPDFSYSPNGGEEGGKNFPLGVTGGGCLLRGL